MIICLSSSLLSNNNKQQICGHGQKGKKWLKGAAANGRKTRDTFVCVRVSDSASKRERESVCVRVTVREWESLATVWRQRVLIFLPRRSQQQQIKDTVNRLGNKKKKERKKKKIYWNQKLKFFQTKKMTCLALTFGKKYLSVSISRDH